MCSIAGTSGGLLAGYGYPTLADSLTEGTLALRVSSISLAGEMRLPSGEPVLSKVYMLCP